MKVANPSPMSILLQNPQSVAVRMLLNNTSNIKPVSISLLQRSGPTIQLNNGLTAKPVNMVLMQSSPIVSIKLSKPPTPSINISLAAMGQKGDKGDPGSGGEKIDLFNPSNGQTVFTLSEAPSVDSNVEMRVNGHKIYSFNRTGVTVTYTGTSYSLTTSDLVEFTYT